MDYGERARKWLFDYGGSSGFTVGTKNQLAAWIEKAEKPDRLLKLFHDQPDQVIQWTPDKRYYSWGFPSQTRATLILQQILEILVEDS